MQGYFETDRLNSRCFSFIFSCTISSTVTHSSVNHLSIPVTHSSVNHLSISVTHSSVNHLSISVTHSSVNHLSISVTHSSVNHLSILVTHSSVNYLSISQSVLFCISMTHNFILAGNFVLTKLFFSFWFSAIFDITSNHYIFIVCWLKCISFGSYSTLLQDLNKRSGRSWP